MSAFIDEVEIFVKAGDGGAGAATFRTEKHVPRGGPDGGDGGRGGSVVFRTDPNLSTLLELRPGKHYRAARGGIGQSRRMFGKDGADLVIDVPPGTQVRDAETGELLADLTNYPQSETIAAGGRGGRGNVHFVSSTHQAPRFAEKGEPGEERRVKVELKLLADVGLLGFPNVGKSTLLARVSAARPKIADYPFTTLVPNLGVVRIDESHHFVMADVPGLIERASEGAGLGIQFLRHLERTRLLVHLIDASGLSGRDPYSDFDVINKELAAFSAPLASLEQVLALSRIDAQPDRAEIEALAAHFRGQGLMVFPISAVTGEGVEALIYHVHQRLQALPRDVAAPMAGSVVYLSARDLKAEEDPRRFTIERDPADDAVLVVKGRGLERAVAMTDMESEDAVRRLQRRMERWGVFRKLKAFGAQDGETVRIGKVEFDYTDDDLEDEGAGE